MIFKISSFPVAGKEDRQQRLFATKHKQGSHIPNLAKSFMKNNFVLSKKGETL